MNYMLAYLSLGLWTWLVLSIARYRMFKNASPLSVLLGFTMGVLIWPIGLYVVFVQERNASDDES